MHSWICSADTHDRPARSRILNMTPQKKINLVNIAFLITIVISSVAPFLPLSFIYENYVANILVSQLLIALPFIVLMAACGMNYPKTVRLKKMKISNVLLTILLGFLVQPLLTFINALSLVFTTNAISSTIYDISKEIPWWGGFLLVALLPAVFEESVYRGVLYNTYKTAHPWKAVLLSALLFGLMHGNLNQFCYAFVMGIIFALIIEATDSILSTMIIHFATNAISTAMIYLFPKLYEFLKAMHTLYSEQGMDSVAKQIEQYVGDLSMSSDEWMQMIFANSSGTHLTLGTVVLTYLPSAVVFSTLAFLLLRVISKRSGTWNRFSVLYLGADEVVVEAEQKSPYEKEKGLDENQLGDPSVRVMTTPLMIAIAVGVLFMFVYETLKLLPR